MSTIDDIRKLYPNPVARRKPGVDCYCVGGAVCRYAEPVLAKTYTFPTVFEICYALVQLNEYLTYRQGVFFARAIVIANDDARLDDAWYAVDQALAWRRP